MLHRRNYNDFCYLNTEAQSHDEYFLSFLKIQRILKVRGSVPLCSQVLNTKRVLLQKDVVNLHLLVESAAAY